MSAASRKNLLFYGYLREYFASISMELPPDDLMKMFASWMMLNVFDQDKSDKNIEFQTDTCISKTLAIEPSYDDNYGCAVGSMIIEKGNKQSWICKIDPHFISVVVGIIDNNTVETKENIGDHTEAGNDGYGIGLNSFGKFHNTEGFGWYLNSYRFDYANQFQKKDGFLMTITLDMTQEKGDGGILLYEFHMKPKSYVNKIETDGKHTTIAWDDINIDRKYRIAISFKASTTHKTLEFLEEIPRSSVM